MADWLVNLLVDPWFWFAIGAAIALIETMVPGYLMLGTGAAALAVAAGLLVALHILPSDLVLRTAPVPHALLAVWGLLSIGVWHVMARLWGRKRHRADDGDINDFQNR